MSKIEREQTCETCYYVEFDGCAYPCSRCTHNKPVDDMWRPKEQEHEQVDSSDNENEVVKALISIRDYLCSGNPIWHGGAIREVMDKAIKAVKEQEHDHID